jgi:hypothetical protein
MDIHKRRMLAIWAIGITLAICQVWSTWSDGRPNGITVLLLAWTWVAAYYYYRREQRLVSLSQTGHPANAVNNLLVSHGFLIHSELEDGWYLFVRARDEAQVRVRVDQEASYVQTGHLVDPWEFEYSAHWTVRGEIPKSLVEAVG